MREERKILKNIILISLSFLLIYTGFLGLARLQSSLHKDEGIGVISSGIIYFSSSVFGMFLPKMMMNKIGHRWTIAISILGFVSWMAANGHAVWATMVPTSILCGMLTGPLWAAIGSYFTLVAPTYASLTNSTLDNVLPKFFGLLIAFFQSSGMIGSIISSAILSTAPHNVTEDQENSTLDISLCGANDCPYYNISNPNLAQPPKTLVWILVGVFIVTALSSFVVVMVFVDELPEELKKKDPITCKNLTTLFLATGKLLKHKEALLLLFITMYNGIEVAFYTAEFSKSYISCSIGMWMVGYVTFPYGIINACSSIVSSRMAKYTGQLPLFISAMVVDLCIQSTLMFWMPHPDQAWVLFVLSSMWGYADGIWQTHILSLYGMVFSFDPDAAFSYRLTAFSTGMFLSFGYSYFLCTFTKIVILTTFLIFGMAGYLLVQIPRMRSKGVYEMDVINISTLSYKGDKSEGYVNKAFTL